MKTRLTHPRRRNLKALNCSRYMHESARFREAEVGVIVLNCVCKTSFITSGSAIAWVALSALMIGCETSPPQVKTAVPISWGESSSLQLSPETESASVPWRKIVVLSRGVLTIGLQANTNGGKVKLNVR
ncbi:hypothetical protein EBR21_07760, partial [bacterium]|nr:hypothetical protein [bacterium]